jgi:hypothetical protein
MPHGPKESPRKRRRGLTASQVLRSLLLMRAKNSDHRELRERTADGVMLRHSPISTAIRCPSVTGSTATSLS